MAEYVNRARQSNQWREGVKAILLPNGDCRSPDRAFAGKTKKAVGGIPNENANRMGCLWAKWRIRSAAWRTTNVAARTTASP